MVGGAGADAAGAVPLRRRAGLGALWFGIFGGPAGWTMQQLIGYAVIAESCFPGRLPRAAGFAPDARLAAGLVSLGALALGAAAGATALASWRSSRAAESEEDAVGSRVRFLAYAGVLVSALFLLAIVLSGMHLLVLSACGG